MTAFIDRGPAPRPAPLPADEDFVLAQEVYSAGEDYRVLPPEGPSREDLERASPITPIAPVWREADEPVKKRGIPRMQFSLVELLAVFTLLATGMSAATWLPLDVFAGVMGAVTLLCFVTFWIRPPQSRFAYLFWGTMGALYVGASAAAVVRSF